MRHPPKIDLQLKQEDFYTILCSWGENAPTRPGYGGARGGGKSKLIRDAMLERRIDNPGTTGFIVRRNFGDLYDNHIVKFQEEYPDISQYYSVSHKEYQFPGGSRIAFRYADTTDEVRKISRGPEAMDIYVDQAEQFSEQELIWLQTPNRWPGSKPGQCKTAYFFNPGGPGTECLRRWYHLKRFKGEERPHDYAFIQAYGWDNYEWFRNEVAIADTDFYRLSSEDRFQLFINHTSYGRTLNALPEALRVGELLGSFESFAGQYFAGVWDEQVCVLPPDLVKRIIQPWWTRWMAQDWGFGDHDAHGWFASGKLSPSQWMEFFGGHTDYPMDVAILYREHVLNNRAEADLAMDIVERTPEVERQQIRRFFLSQDAFGQKAKQHGAHTVGEQFANIMRRYHLPLPEPADQDRINGWRFMYNCLRQANLRGQIITQERAKEGPAFFVSAECPMVIEGIPMATRDEDDIEDVIRVDGALWEDVTDMVRYGLKSQLRPKTKAPLDVRAKELYHSIQGDDGDAMTRRAMAMAEFKVKENRITRVQRMPRWR